MARYRPSLTVSILAFLGLLLVLTWLLFSLLAFKTAANDLYAQKGEHARTLLKVFVNLLPDEIPAYPDGFISSGSQASLYAQKISEESGFSRLTLLDRNGKVIYSAGQAGNDPYSPFQSVIAAAVDGNYIRPDGTEIVSFTTVVRAGEAVGRAGLLLSLTPEKNRLNRSRQLLVTYFVLDFILLFGLGSYVLSRIVVSPINRLLAATEKITGGHYSQKLPVSGSAELARLAAAFNTMASSLRSKDLLVSEQMAALEKANTDLRQAREETIRTEKMASIGVLAAGMAHEIGTPLASIMGYAELSAAEQPDNTAIQDYSRRITEDCVRIDRIVRGLLDYSRPRVLSGERADIREVVTSTLDLLKQQGVFKQIGLQLDIPEGQLFVKCDQHQLQQVVINLLLNSRDACSFDGVVTVRSSREGDYIRLDVIDNGSGIDGEIMKYIFDPFFTTKAPGKGTGLGLAISARIVEGFGGRITANSEIGTGSCFSICLPPYLEGGVAHES
jgi:signal transduction histidine kinase